MIFSLQYEFWNLELAKEHSRKSCRIFKSQRYNDGFACFCNGSEEDVRDNFDRSSFN